MDGCGFYRVIGEHEDGKLCMAQWNPLADNGDALHLLGDMSIRQYTRKTPITRCPTCGGATLEKMCCFQPGTFIHTCPDCNKEFYSEIEAMNCCASKYDDTVIDGRVSLSWLSNDDIVVKAKKLGQIVLF